MMTTKLQIDQLRREVGFLAISEMTPDDILETDSTRIYIKIIISNTGLTTFRDSYPVAIIGETRLDHIMTASTRDTMEENSNSTYGHSCVVSRVVRLPPMSETMVQIRPSLQKHSFGADSRELGPETARHNRARYSRAALGISFHIKIASLSSSCTTLPKGVRLASCIVPPQWKYGGETVEHKPGTLNAVPSYKNSQSEAELLHQRYDNKQQIAKLPDWLWTETIKFREKYGNIEPVFLTMIKKYDPMWASCLRLFNVAKHRIVLEPTNAPHIHQAPYHAGLEWLELERQETKRLRAKGVAEPAVAKWGSLAVLMPKKDGSLRVCVDYRRLNATKERNSYLILWMDEWSQLLDKTKLFSSLDAITATRKLKLIPRTMIKRPSSHIQMFPET